jgi:hypothetical protein
MLVRSKLTCTFCLSLGERDKRMKKFSLSFEGLEFEGARRSFALTKL